MQFRSSFLLTTLAVAACGYSAPDEVINGQAVAAVQKNATTWSSYTTFTIANLVQVVDNTTGTGESYTRDAPQLIEQVRKNMVARGYREIPFTPGVQADLVIGLLAYLGNQTYGGYYCGWYYYGYYPYGCSYYYYGSYNTGTLVIQMGDFANAPPQVPGNKVQTVWESAMYGILSTQQYNLQIALNSIDRAFEQSPYLKKTP